MIVHLEGGSHHIFMDIYNYFNFLHFRNENVFRIINRNIKKPQYIANNNMISLR